MPSSKLLRLRFTEQKAVAKRRGIPFLFSFDEWLQIWKTSGHLNNRGRKKGMYCMARLGDKGGYEKDNIEIILHAKNAGDARRRNPPTKQTKARISKSLEGNQRALNPSKKTRKRLADAKYNWWNKLTPKELKDYKTKMSNSIKRMHRRRKQQLSNA